MVAHRQMDTPTVRVIEFVTEKDGGRDPLKNSCPDAATIYLED